MKKKQIKKRLINIIFSKPMVIGYLIIVELLFLFAILGVLSSISSTINGVFRVLSLLMVVYVYNRNDIPSYKMAWISLILIVPLFGGVLYLLFGGQKIPKALRRQISSAAKDKEQVLTQDPKFLEELKYKELRAYNQAKYIWENGGYPVLNQTQTTFIKDGEMYYRYLLEAVKRAEHFIFLEYFILEEGKMWGDILEVLIQKAQEGVDVRLMFDDAGCITKLPKDYDLKMRNVGIACRVFNPIRARLAIKMNNRDHRKITVIDGKVGFTGGINLADEYMNEVEVYGHWRDQGVMLEGLAVNNLTVMFLQFWDYLEEKETNYHDYLTNYTVASDGYVVPFSDSPTDEENVGHCIHLSLIQAATQYVYIQTPYLILDHVTQHSLKLAAKSGVDVRIMVPHIPDKKLVFQVTRSNYLALLESGVKIYEYLPGFVHAKTIVSDGIMGVIGSINLDYRSYFLHFECGAWMYESRALEELRCDFEKTLSQCHEVTLEEYQQTNVLIRFLRAILNFFAPLL